MKLISKARPVDLCLYFPPRPKGTVTEADCHAIKWSELIARDEFIAVRGHADEIYWAVACARSDCPDVKELEGGLGLLWSNQKRSLFVKVLPGGVHFLMSNDDEGPMPLQTVANYDKLEETFFKLGRYVSGKAEKDCIPRREKV